ncbi:nucleic acid-binding, OB-fold protein [Tanacetum coccineum]
MSTPYESTPTETKQPEQQRRNEKETSWWMGGRGGRIAECLIGDETGTILFTARNDQVDLMKAGNVGVGLCIQLVQNRV